MSNLTTFEYTSLKSEKNFSEKKESEVHFPTSITFLIRQRRLREKNIDPLCLLLPTNISY